MAKKYKGSRKKLQKRWLFLKDGAVILGSYYLFGIVLSFILSLAVGTASAVVSLQAPCHPQLRPRNPLERWKAGKVVSIKTRKFMFRVLNVDGTTETFAFLEEQFPGFSRERDYM